MLGNCFPREAPTSSSCPFCSNRTSTRLPTPQALSGQSHQKPDARRGGCGQLSDLPRTMWWPIIWNWRNVWKSLERAHDRHSAPRPPQSRECRGRTGLQSHDGVRLSPRMRPFKDDLWALGPFLRTNQDGREQFIPPPGIIANFVSTRPILAEEAEKEGIKLSNIHIIIFIDDDFKKSINML